MTQTERAPVTHFDTIEALEAFLEETATMPMQEPGLYELEHGLQCAVELEAAAPTDIELQVAGLVHDVCHGQCHIRIHDTVGGEAVRQVLGDRVADLVKLHVVAKRYLVTKQQDYAGILSPISVETLALQGGPLTADEVAAFEANPLAQDAILLRKADDAAKTPGRVTPGLDYWRPRLRQVAAQAAAMRA